MAVCKMLGFRHDTFLTVFTKCWSIKLRNVSKSRIIAELIGCPDKPKKPKNQFLRFAISVRPKIAALSDSKCSNAEIMKKIGSEWRGMSDSEKEKYIKEFEEDNIKYKEELKAYNYSLTKENKRDLMDLKNKIMKLNSGQGFIYLKDGLEKPLMGNVTRHTLFGLFCSEVGFKKGLTGKENLKNLSDQWKNLSDTEKQKYVLKYKKEVENYKEALKNWKLKVIKEGNVNIIKRKQKRLP